jgi:hypothetical protein
MAIRGLDAAISNFIAELSSPLFFFPKPCNHSLLHPCGRLPFLLGLRGCQETLPGVCPLWYITEAGEVCFATLATA